jgi:serine protease Do
MTAGEGGLMITDVDPSSDLAEKGLRPGDVILQAGGHAIHTVAEFTAAANDATRAHRPLLMQVDSQGRRIYIAAATEHGAG